MTIQGPLDIVDNRNLSAVSFPIARTVRNRRYPCTLRQQGLTLEATVARLSRVTRGDYEGDRRPARARLGSNGDQGVDVTFYNDAVRNSSATAYDERLVPWYFQHWANRMVELADLEPSGQIVDLACGSGMITRALLPSLGPAGTIAGIDLNPGMLAHAQSTIDDARVSWHEADASSLPLDDASVDVLCCHQGLQFFPDRGAAIDEVHRILRPGGRIVVAVWGHLDGNPEVVAMSHAIGEFLGDDLGRAMTGPCGFPVPEELQQLLGDHGFVDTRVESVSEIARHPDVRDAMDGQFDALPISGSIEALGPARRTELLDRICEVLEPYVDENDALAIPATNNFAVGTKP
ncbi:MAG: class I SAM-dependent methyltransferase [Acidimicrobiales bacterium]